METMRDDSGVETRSDGAAEFPPAQSLVAMRERARRLLHAQQDRIREFEDTLQGHIESLLDEHRAQQRSALQREEDLSTQIAALTEDLQRSETSRRELEETLDEARVALSRVSNEQRELHRQVAEGQRLLDTRAEELEELRAQLANRGPDGEQAFQELAALRNEVDELQAESDKLQRERDELQTRLDEALRCQESPSADPANSPEMQDLQERFEMAVQEVRELKSQNERLEQELNRGEPASSAPEATPSQGFDWEAQKQRLLAQLETDFDESDPEQAQDKLTVEGAIRITDQVVAEKEREIDGLQALLQNQSDNLGQVAVGAAALTEMLDHDELIQQERENLSRLQEEWREKLRKAEVDISVERAKIARERMQLEEKLRSLEAEQSRYADKDAGDDSADKSQKPSRGRWLTRLGLKEDD
jgi:chromosome segregation ATPase